MNKPIAITKREPGWTVHVKRYGFGNGPIYLPLAVFPTFENAISYVDRRIHSDVTS